MAFIDRLFKARSPNKTNLKKIKMVLNKKLPKKVNLDDSSFKNCKNYNDCFLATTGTDDSSLKIIMPKENSQFIKFIKQQSNELKTAFKEFPETIPLQERIDVIAEAIIQNSPKNIAPTKVKSAIVKMIGHKEVKVSGITSQQ